jgi:hypothetical protein
MSLPTFTGLMTPAEAVNICLTAANLAPINSEVNIEEHVAAYAAWLLILEESRQVQSSGWHFNTNYNFIIEPNTEGEIALPSAYLKVYVHGGRYAARGTRLYDRHRNTYTHEFPVTIQRLVILLEWDELMQQARYYVTVRAARRFLASRAGSEVAKEYSSTSEMDARIALEQADAELAEPNAEFHSAQVNHWKRRGR